MKLKTFIGVVCCCFAFSAFSQESKWKVGHFTNDFGDKSGNCYISSHFYDEKGDFIQISFAKIKETGMSIGINYEFDAEITEREAYLSIKTEDGIVVLSSHEGSFLNNGINTMAIFKANDIIIWAFLEFSKLKLALRLSGYKPLIIDVDCIGFTKAYNKMLNCM